jgi:ribosomal protein S18 acetylase RimI-like enzyme
MLSEIPGITFEKADAVPYHLLLLADPSREMVDGYLKQSEVFVAVNDQKVIGTVVLYPKTETLAEIKNIAVDPEFQGKGIGHWLLHNIAGIAKQKGYKAVCIGTANSSIAQLYLYQKLGFEISEIIQGFFTDNYPEPIYEKGIRAKDLIMLVRQL